MKTIIAVIFLVFIIIIGMTTIEKQNALFYNSLSGSVASDEYNTNTQNATILKVTISGEVQVPGKYEVIEGSYLDDVIEQAGGITSMADLYCFDNYLVIEEDLSIYIPPSTEEEKLSINDASEIELMTLTGIGKTLANRIVTYRENDADGFSYLEEIMKVEGVGKSIFNKIKDKICL